jgi:hypothetical protein
MSEEQHSAGMTLSPEQRAWIMEEIKKQREQEAEERGRAEHAKKKKEEEESPRDEDQEDLDQAQPSDLMASYRPPPKKNPLFQSAPTRTVSQPPK